MIWTIAQREFLEKILDYRVVTSFAIAIMLTIVATVVAGDEYYARKTEFDRLAAQSQAVSHEIRVYSKYQPVVYDPPSPLSIFCRGIDIPTPITVTIQVQTVPQYSQREAGQNPMMRMFDTLDIATVVRVLFGLMVILLTFDSFSGEKESGTLRQALSNPIGRMKLVYGKFIGMITIVCVVVLFIYLIAIAVLRLSSGFVLTPEDYFRVVLIALATILYLAVFAALGILASIKFHNSSTSLAVLLFAWFFLAILQPNLTTYIVSRFENKEWFQNLVSALDNAECGAMKELEQLHKDRGGVLNDPSKRKFVESRMGCGTNDEPFEIENVMADADYDILDYTIHQAYLWRKLADCADKEFAMHKSLLLDHLDALLGWKRTLEIFSPAALFSRSVSIISKTDIDNVDRFFQRARDYRAQYLAYLDQKGVFSTNAQLFFSRLNKDEIDRKATEARLRQYEKKVSSPRWVSAQPPLDLRDAPVFNAEESSIGPDFVKAVGSLGLLLCYLVILFFMTGRSMRFYDPR